MAREGLLPSGNRYAEMDLFTAAKGTQGITGRDCIWQAVTKVMVSDWLN